jgi:hypothetical protein
MLACLKNEPLFRFWNSKILPIRLGLHFCSQLLLILQFRSHLTPPDGRITVFHTVCRRLGIIGLSIVEITNSAKLLLAS